MRAAVIHQQGGPGDRFGLLQHALRRHSLTISSVMEKSCVAEAPGECNCRAQDGDQPPIAIMTSSIGVSPERSNSIR